MRLKSKEMLQTVAVDCPPGNKIHVVHCNDRRVQVFDQTPGSADGNAKNEDVTGVHVAPRDGHDRFALGLVKFMRVFADKFFAKRYGHRAVVLETVAAVPGMVGGLLQHLKAIRHIREDQGWIKELLEEADNERMHLMTFIHIAEPSRMERLLIMVGQAIFYNFYFFLYLFAPRTAHRVVAYLEEEAVVSYTQYLEEVDAGRVENVPAPDVAIEYWGLPQDARLREVIIAVRADEAGHRDKNHEFADQIASGEHL